MFDYAASQEIGLRDNQCDATAVHTTPTGARAYVLLDGVGDSETVRDWTQAAAERLAVEAAQLADAEKGLRTVYDGYAAERTVTDHPSARRYRLMPKAAAVVAVTAPDQPLTVAWCGDSRAYLVTEDGASRQLTDDHNLRRVYPAQDGLIPGSRHVITSCLGARFDDEARLAEYGHPAIEAVTLPMQAGLLLLASDGAYEPHEDDGRRLFDELTGNVHQAAVNFTKNAVHRAITASRALDPNRAHADNATALVAELSA